MDLDLEHRKIMDLLGELHALKNTFLSFVEALKPAPVDDWLFIEDVMRIFKKSNKTIQYWCQKGFLPCRRMGRTTYFLKSEIYTLVEQKVSFLNNQEL